MLLNPENQANGNHAKKKIFKSVLQLLKELDQA
jgi:hypothetical protein